MDALKITRRDLEQALAEALKPALESRAHAVGEAAKAALGQSLDGYFVARDAAGEVSVELVGSFSQQPEATFARGESARPLSALFGSFNTEVSS